MKFQEGITFKLKKLNVTVTIQDKMVETEDSNKNRFETKYSNEKRF
jgi:translation elongation factor EF-1beta